jgi:hypothetical protein
LALNPIAACHCAVVRIRLSRAGGRIWKVQAVAGLTNTQYKSGAGAIKSQFFQHGLIELEANLLQAARPNRYGTYLPLMTRCSADGGTKYLS